MGPTTSNERAGHRQIPRTNFDLMPSQNSPMQPFFRHFGMPNDEDMPRSRHEPHGQTVTGPKAPASSSAPTVMR